MDFDFTSETLTLDITQVLTVTGTGALTLPAGTTAEEPTGVAGMIRWNSTVPQLEYYNGTAWVSLGTAGLVTSITGTTNEIAAGGVFTAQTGAVTLTTPTTFVAPGSVQVTTSFQTSATNTISAAGTTQGTATALT